MSESRVLVTGSRGLIGATLGEALPRAGYGVVPFDRLDGHDVRDADAVSQAASGCRHVVHLAALIDPADDGDDVMAVNVLGTWNVLRAARDAGVERVVYLSSVNALGVFRGESEPDYLPIDDDHPCCPRSTYGMSKVLCEQMCRMFSETTGISTICLRPPGVWSDDTYARIQANRAADPAFEWSPFWEYGAFLDVRDAADACIAALTCPDPGHVTTLLCATDISTSGPTSREHAARLLPGVPWRGGAAYETDSYRALVDTTRAREILGFESRHTWREWLERGSRGVKHRS